MKEPGAYLLDLLRSENVFEVEGNVNTGKDRAGVPGAGRASDSAEVVAFPEPDLRVNKVVLR